MRRKNALLLCVAVLAVAVCGLGGCAKVDSGHGGVLWTAWGGTQEGSYAEGWYFVAPWNKMFTYNIRTQDKREDLHVLAKNGLSIKLESSVRFKAKADALFSLHTTIGPEYYEVILAPAIRSAAREVGGRYTPEEIYSTKRAAVEHDVFEATTAAIKDRPVVLEAILVRNVDLPDKLKRAINEKLEEEQRALKMKFTLDKELQEAERKRIEAEGVARRNRIITESISDPLLRYKGIEVTGDIAKSNNAKVIIIGSGKDGLPLILGGS